MRTSNIELPVLSLIQVRRLLACSNNTRYRVQQRDTSNLSSKKFFLNELVPMNILQTVHRIFSITAMMSFLLSQVNIPNGFLIRKWLPAFYCIGSLQIWIVRYYYRGHWSEGSHCSWAHPNFSLIVEAKNRFTCAECQPHYEALNMSRYFCLLYMTYNCSRPPLLLTFCCYGYGRDHYHIVKYFGSVTIYTSPSTPSYPNWVTKNVLYGNISSSAGIEPALGWCSK